MAILEIKRAAERHLLGLSPSVPTAYEGVSFTPPSTIYQRVQVQPRRIEDPVLGAGFHREIVSFQVFVVSPVNQGTAEAISRAELIRDRFKKGTSLLESNIRIHILSTPQIAGASVQQDRIIVPVLIELVAEVYSY